MNSIEISSLNFSYNEDQILKDLDFIVNDGELVVVYGENGSGKSTLLKLLLGEIKAQSGTVKLFEENINKISSFKHLGYVPQMNIVNKIPFPITCLELVVLNLYEDFGFIKIPKKKHLTKAKNILIKMDLEKYINVPFNELSGGLQQRVLISRAIINNPKALILDEPTAGVDEESKALFFETINKLNSESNITVILVTHELDAAKDNLNLDKVYLLEKGGLNNVSV